MSAIGVARPAAGPPSWIEEALVMYPLTSTLAVAAATLRYRQSL